MDQIAFFDADSTPPSPEDLAGLLAGTGHAVRAAGGARLSVIVAERWRADALVDAITDALGAADTLGAEVEVTASGRGGLLVRTSPAEELAELARAWSRGAVKAVPAGWAPSPRAQRIWAIAAGRADAVGYALGLDPHAEHIHTELAAAATRAGLAVTPVGVRAGGPALRLTGRRGAARLRENIGPAPAGAGSDWPGG